MARRAPLATPHWAPACRERHADGTDETGQSALDFRLVAAGALLPDLIDKPLKWYLFSIHSRTITSTRHTLLPPVLLILAASILARRGDTCLLALGLGCSTHPLVDAVLMYPRTLFWPTPGTEFPDAESFIPVQWTVDLALVAAGAWLLSRDERFRNAVRDFLDTGQLPSGEAAILGDRRLAYV